MNGGRDTFCRVRITTPDTLLYGPSRVFEFGTDAGGPLKAVNVNLTLDSVNSFELHFAPVGIEDQSWPARIPQYSVVEIEMGASGGGGADPLVMVGITSPGVDGEVWTGASPQRTSTISGRGVEGVLQDARVWLAPFLELHKDRIADELRRTARGFFDNVLGSGQLVFDSKVVTGGMDPREAILAVWAYYMVNHPSAVISLSLPQPYRIRDLLVPGEWSSADVDAMLASYTPGERITTPTPRWWTTIGDVIGKDLTLPTAALRPTPGPVLQLMHQFLDVEFHELFVVYDSMEQGRPGGVGKARLIHRTKPFAPIDARVSGATLFNLDEPSLRTVEITEGDIMSIGSLTHGITPVYNVFFCQPGDSALLNDQGIRASYPPAYAKDTDPAFVGRFGVRPLEHRTPFFATDRNPDPEGQGALIEALQSMQDVLYAWHAPAPDMKAATLAVAGRSEHRAGNRVIWKPVDAHGHNVGRPTREWYCTAVRKSYDFASGAFLDTLQLTRGWTVANTGLPPDAIARS